MTTGIVLNNWLNIRPSIPPTRWEGMATTQPNPGYVSFISPKWSIRAGATILRHYRQWHKLDTIAGMIERWAPPSDHNPTDAYVRNVSDWTGYPPDAHLDLDDATVLVQLLTAMVRQEIGYVPPEWDTTIVDGVRLALSSST